MKCIACLQDATHCACPFHEPILPPATFGGDEMTSENRRLLDEQVERQEHYAQTGELLPCMIR